MKVDAHWSVVWLCLALMAVSSTLSFSTSLWRERRPATRTWRSRTHWEWLPFMAAATVITVELPRLLGAPDTGISIADTVGHVLSVTTVLIFFRAVVLLALRAVRLAYRGLRRGTTTSG